MPKVNPVRNIKLKGKKNKTPNGVKIEKGKCKGCELCIFYCPLKSLELSSTSNKRGVKFANFKKGAECSGCGFCFLICPDRCISIYKPR